MGNLLLSLSKVLVEKRQRPLESSLLQVTAVKLIKRDLPTKYESNENKGTNNNDKSPNGCIVSVSLLIPTGYQPDVL